MGNVNGICCFLARGACGSLFQQVGDFLGLLAVQNMYSEKTLDNKPIIFFKYSSSSKISLRSPSLIYETVLNCLWNSF